VGEPRQIVGFSVAADKSPERIQAIVDSAPEAQNSSKRLHKYRDSPFSVLDFL